MTPEFSFGNHPAARKNHGLIEAPTIACTRFLKFGLREQTMAQCTWMVASCVSAGDASQGQVKCKANANCSDKNVNVIRAVLLYNVPLSSRKGEKQAGPGLCISQAESKNNFRKVISKNVC